MYELDPHNAPKNVKVTIHFIATVKQGDNALGSVSPSVCPYVRAILFIWYDLNLKSRGKRPLLVLEISLSLCNQRAITLMWSIDF